MNAGSMHRVRRCLVVCAALAVAVLFLTDVVQSSELTGEVPASPSGTDRTAVPFSLKRTLLPRGTEQITSLAVIDDEGRQICVGTERGEMYVTRDGGDSWIQVKQTTVVRGFVETIRDHGPELLERISEIDPEELDQFFALVEQEGQVVDFDIGEISFEDLSFEDIDLAAVDPSDVEFREEYIDPGTVVLEDLDEDDIENIEITDESYLLNPDDISGQIDQEQIDDRIVSEERQFSEDNLRRLLLRYAGTFLAVRDIALVERAGQSVILACTPLAVYQSLDGARSWLPLVVADWEHGEYFLSCFAARQDRKRAVIISSEAVRVTFDGGITWARDLIQEAADDIGQGRFLDGEQAFAGLTGDSRLIRVPLSADAFAMSSEEIRLPSEFADEVSLFDIRDKTQLVVTTLGVVLSNDGGGTWREIPAPEMNPAALRKIIIADGVKQTILAIYRDIPLISVDAGRKWTGMHLGGAINRVSLLVTFFTPDRRLIVYIVDGEEISILSFPVDDDDRPALPANLAERPPTLIEPPAAVHEPPDRLLSLHTAIARAHRFHLWDLSEFGRWRTRASLAGYFPRLSIVANYLDRDQTTMQYAQNYQFSAEPDYYIADPLTHQHYDYWNEYFTINFAFQWDLSRIVHPMDVFMVNDKLVSSHRRMVRQERKIRTIITDRIRLEERSRTERGGSVAAEVERILRIQELDSLLWMLSDGPLQNEMSHDHQSD